MTGTVPPKPQGDLAGMQELLQSLQAIAAEIRSLAGRAGAATDVGIQAPVGDQLCSQAEDACRSGNAIADLVDQAAGLLSGAISQLQQDLAAWQSAAESAAATVGKAASGISHALGL